MLTSLFRPLALACIVTGCGPAVSQLNGAIIDVAMTTRPTRLSLNLRGETQATCTDFRYDVSLAGVSLADVSAGGWRADGAFASSPACLSTTYRTTTASAEAIVSALESGEPLRFSDGAATVTAAPPRRCVRTTLTAPVAAASAGGTIDLEYAPADAAAPSTLRELPAGCRPWEPSFEACASSGRTVALGTVVRDGLVRFTLPTSAARGTFEVYGESNDEAFAQCAGFLGCNWSCRAPTNGAVTLTIQ